MSDNSKKYSVYIAINKVNGKKYVGQTVNFNKRKKEHIAIASGTQPSKGKYPIHYAIENYGVSNFIWKIIESNLTLDESNQKEKEYIIMYDSLCPNGYNIWPGGNNVTPHPETRKKISETLKLTSWFIGRSGKDHPNFGRKISEEEKIKTGLRTHGENSPTHKITANIVINI